MTPGIGAVHRQNIVDANLPGGDQTMEGRVPDEACNPRAGPLRKREDLLVRSLRAAQALVSDNYRRLVGVQVDAEVGA